MGPLAKELAPACDVRRRRRRVPPGETAAPGESAGLLALRGVRRGRDEADRSEDLSLRRRRSCRTPLGAGGHAGRPLMLIARSRDAGAAGGLLRRAGSSARPTRVRVGRRCPGRWRRREPSFGGPMTVSFEELGDVERLHAFRVVGLLPLSERREYLIPSYRKQIHRINKIQQDLQD